MVIANQTVIHKAFGRGGATGVDGAYISVLFPCGEKRFVFPDAFGQFLRFEDEKMQSEAEQMIESLRSERQNESDRRVEELTLLARENKARIDDMEKWEFSVQGEYSDESDELNQYVDEISAVFDWRPLSLEPAVK